MIVDGYDSFLLDLDGVMFLRDEPISGAAESVARLRKLGKGIAFVTNNSSRTQAEVAEHLGTVGVAASPDEVETSALSTAAMLAERGLGTAFVVGEEGVRQALVAVGIKVVDRDADSADAVVIGLDRGADYDKLMRAALLVQGGAEFIATNADASFPAPRGERWPGAGALLAAVETTVGRRAEVVGKPYAPILLRALARAGGGRPLVVGDRIDTDIAGAAGLGWDSLLVLSGISSAADAAAADPAPTYVGADVSALFGAPR
jgi:glycerol-1-phosphatase